MPNQDEHDTGFPKLSAAARRALPAGYGHSGQLAQVLESATEQLHGVRPTGITALRGAFDERGLAFHF